MIKNIHCTSWDTYTNELGQRLNEQTSLPLDISSIEDVENLAAMVQNTIIKSYEVTCLL